MGADWEAIRKEFPALENRTFLNTATYGQLAKRTTAAVAEHFNRRDELACSDFLAWFDDMDEVRNLVGKLIGCQAADVAFLPNASSGLALLMNGLKWQPGDRIVTLTNEFPNNTYFPYFLDSRGVELIESEWEGFYAAVNSSTRLVLMSSASYATGFTPPLEEISKFLRGRNILFYVDGTQSVGALRMDIQAVQPDMMVVHGYKWLLAPNGAAFAYVSPELRRTLPPSVIGWRSDSGWRSVDALQHGSPALSDGAEKYEGGMLNFPSLYGMRASIEMMLEIGPETIEKRVRDLSRATVQLLEQAGGVVLHRDSHILAAQFSGVDASALAGRLKERGILVSARHGALRVSTHFYNSEDDLARLAAGLH